MRSVWEDRVFGLKDTGLSDEKVAKRISEERGVKVTAKQVRTILRKNEPRRSYVPSSLTDKQKWEPITARVVELQRADKTMRGPELKQIISDEFDEKITSRMISQARVAGGFEHRVSRYGSFVRAANKPKRVAWAKEMKEKGVSFINHIFVDESSVHLDPTTRTVWVEKGDAYGHIQPAFKFPIRVMIWVGVCMNGMTDVCIMKSGERLNSAGYLDIIEKFYVPAANKFYGGDCYLVQDNAPVHSSKYTKEGLLRMGVKVWPWPAESPDMMPAELVFAKLKSDLPRLYKPKTKEELEEAIKDWCSKVDKDLCASWVRHIYPAMDAVIRRNGSPLKVTTSSKIERCHSAG